MSTVPLRSVPSAIYRSDVDSQRYHTNVAHPFRHLAPYSNAPEFPRTSPRHKIVLAAIGKVALANEKDVDLAVAAARKAYSTAWGLKVPGTQRGALLLKLADLIEKNADELAALESLNNGSSSHFASSF